MKKAVAKSILISSIFIAVIQIASCKKEPTQVTTATPPPPPPPGGGSSCQGSWVCVGGAFTSIRYAFPHQGWGAFGAAVATGNKIFIAGGHDEVVTGGDFGNINVYNIITNTTDKMVYLSTPRNHLAGAYAGNKILFAGGYNARCTYCGNLEVYDNIDMYDAGSYAMTTARLSEARSDLASASIDNKAYFIGGKTLKGYSKKMDVYDANTDKWSVVELPNARAYAGAAVIKKKIYICGGTNETGALKTIDVYDVETQTWSVLQAPNEHSHAATTALNNKLFIAGANGPLDFFNTSNNTWKTMQLSDARYDMAVGVANNKIIFLGGNYSSQIDTYDDNSETVSSSSLSEGVTGVMAASVGDKCFFAGFLYQKGWAITNTMIIIQP